MMDNYWIRSKVWAVMALFAALIAILPKAVHGQETFRKAIGNFGEDMGYCVRQVDDGGYVICGVTSSASETSSSVYLLKIDSSGNLLWSRSFGTDTGTDVARKLLVLENGEMVIVGYTNSAGVDGYDVLVIKTDSQGHEQWSKTFGGLGWDFGNDIILLPNGNYGIAGSTYSFGNGGSDGYFLEVSPNGDEVNSTSFGGEGHEEFNSLAVSDGNLYFCGRVDNPESGADALVVRADLSGDEVWTRVYGGVEEDYLAHIIATSDGNLLAVGSSSSVTPVNKEFYFMKITPAGQALFERRDGGDADEEAREIVEDADGNYAFVGYTTSHGAGGSAMMLFKITADGWWILSRQYGSISDEEGRSIAVTQDGGYILAGHTYGFNADQSDVFVVKTDNLGLTGASGDVDAITDTMILSLTDPDDTQSIPRVVITDTELRVLNQSGSPIENVELLDINGKLVNSKRGDLTDPVVSLDISGLPNGVYFVRVLEGGQSTSLKFGLIR
jgi:hypothetical protein